jgi:hypothetical protein
MRANHCAFVQFSPPQQNRSVSQSAVTLRPVATSIQFTPCSTAMNRGDGLVGSLQGIELFH